MINPFLGYARTSSKFFYVGIITDSQKVAKEYG